MDQVRLRPTSYERPSWRCPRVTWRSCRQVRASGHQAPSHRVTHVLRSRPTLVLADIAYTRRRSTTPPSRLRARDQPAHSDAGLAVARDRWPISRRDRTAVRFSRASRTSARQGTFRHARHGRRDPRHARGRAGSLVANRRKQALGELGDVLRKSRGMRKPCASAVRCRRTPGSRLALADLEQVIVAAPPSAMAARVLAARSGGHAAGEELEELLPMPRTTA